jgi:hypothetical protein
MIPNHMSSSFQEKTVASARCFDVYQGMEQRSFAVNTFSKTYVSWVKSLPREIGLLILGRSWYERHLHFLLFVP